MGGGATGERDALLSLDAVKQKNRCFITVRQVAAV